MVFDEGRSLCSGRFYRTHPYLSHPPAHAGGPNRKSSGRRGRRPQRRGKERTPFLLQTRPPGMRAVPGIPFIDIRFRFRIFDNPCKTRFRAYRREDGLDTPSDLALDSPRLRRCYIHLHPLRNEARGPDGPCTRLPFNLFGNDTHVPYRHGHDTRVQHHSRHIPDFAYFFGKILGFRRGIGHRIPHVPSDNDPDNDGIPGKIPYPSQYRRRAQQGAFRIRRPFQGYDGRADMLCPYPP